MSFRNVSCIVLVYVTSISEMLFKDTRKLLFVPFMGEVENLNLKIFSTVSNSCKLSPYILGNV